MANVHFKKHLIHQATVQRAAIIRSSSGEAIRDWDNLSIVGTMNCRYVQKRERVADPSLGLMVSQQDLILCNQGEDVQEEDRIVNIILRADSSTVDAGPFAIEALLERSSTGLHHITLEVERVE